MRFQDIIGHQDVKKHLIETYQSSRTAHAQIFLGPEGSGKLALALAYIQYLLCENPTEEDSCGECNACKKVNRYIHPDVHFSYPTIGSKQVSTNFVAEWRELLKKTSYPVLNQWLNAIDAKNQQGNITKDECVRIIKQFSLKKLEGNYKALIMWLPEYLGKEGNRLLKLIEEPEPNTIFIFVAEQSSKILNTILSRCQIVRIPRLSDEQVQEYLNTNLDISPDKAIYLSQLAEGNLSKAIGLIDDAQDAYSQLLMTWLRVAYQGHAKLVLNWVDGILTGKDRKTKKATLRLSRKDQLAFLQYGLHFFRQCLVHSYRTDANVAFLNEAESIFAQKLTTLLKLEHIQTIAKTLDENIYYIERNANPKILFTELTIALHKVFRKSRSQSVA
ncbi:MAG: hypothetical protein GY810_17055 [Aureispira sp.]|nr:hypothetical protein [Aureispira sp.]